MQTIKKKKISIRIHFPFSILPKRLKFLKFNGACRNST